MSDDVAAGEPLSDRQKKEIAVWFLSNAPAGEIRYVAKGNPPAPPPPRF
jgi:capping protein (actin filament) muscle Z-line, alpha